MRNLTVLHMLVKLTFEDSRRVVVVFSIRCADVLLNNGLAGSATR